MNVIRTAAVSSLSLFAFFIPLFPSILPLLAGLVIATLIFISYDNRKGIMAGTSWLLASFFVFNALGMFWTSNLTSGYQDIERKMSLLLFPILMYSASPFIDERMFWIIKRSFIVGVLTAAALLLIHATYWYYVEYFEFINGVWRENHYFHAYFFSSLLSPLVHPSYMALYACFALILLFETRKSVRLFWFLLGYLFIAVFIFLLASKAGLLGFAIIAAVHSVQFYRTSENKKTVAVFIVLIVLTTGAVVLKNPEIRNRLVSFELFLKSGKPSDPTESSYSRTMAWKAAAGVISEHPVLGAGTGDVQTELNKKYLSAEFTFGLEKNLNCHNQFLESYLAGGIICLFSLIALLFSIVIYKPALNNSIHILFVLLIVLNFTVESMLETQAGILFFAFFQSVLFAEKHRSSIAGNDLKL